MKESRGEHIISDPTDYSQIPYGGIEELDISDEKPFLLEVKRQYLSRDKGYEIVSDISGVDSIWFDLLNNSLGVLMFSEKALMIIKNSLNGNEVVRWVRCKVRGNGETRIYFIPRFDIKEDVLNESLSSISYDRFWVKKPVLDSTKIDGKALINGSGLFRELDKYPLSLYVSNKLRKEMMANQLTGIGFDRLNIV